MRKYPSTQVAFSKGNSIPSKERSSNLELFRIIVMLLIVMHHYVVNSGLLDILNANPLSMPSLFYASVGFWGKTGINCFVLITGYFMCKSNITLRKFLKLLCQIYTYNFIFYFIFLLAGLEVNPLLSLFQQTTMLIGFSGNFTICFLFFWLGIPFLNVLIQNLNKKQHLSLVLLSLLVYTIIGSLPMVEVRINYVLWFGVLYIVASYIRLYGIYKDNNTRFWGGMTCVSLSLSLSSIYAISYVNQHFGKSIPVDYMISDCNHILGVMLAISAFMFFKNWNLKNSRYINTIAASSFGVLLIHANSNTMRQWLWKDTIDCIGHFDTPYYWLYAIGSVLAIYAICTVIDFIRIKTIETPLLNVTEKACYWVRDNFLKVE